MFPLNNGRLILRMKFFGGIVSQDRGFIEGLSLERVFRIVELMHLLPKLRDPQSEICLIQYCLSIG